MSGLALPAAFQGGRYTKQQLVLGLAVLVAHGLALHVIAQGLRAANPPVFNKPLQMRAVTLATADPNAAAQAAPSPKVPSPETTPTPKPPRERSTIQPQVTTSVSDSASLGGQIAVASTDPGNAAPVAKALTQAEIDALALASAQAEIEEARRAAAAAASAPQSTASAPGTAPAPVAKVAFTVPGSVRIRYNATAVRPNVENPFYGFGEILWQHDGSSYLAQVDAGLTIFGIRRKLRSVKSTGKLTTDGLRPERFSDSAGTEVAAHFDRTKGQVVFSANTPSATLEEGHQDQATIFLQLASMLQGQPERFPPGTALVFPVVGPRALETWQFTIGALETLQLPGGTLAAIKVDKAPAHAFDSRVEIWLAPSQAYVPVRIRSYERNGDVIDLQWRDSGPP